MVATLVSVPRASRAASSHSSFTSTVMRVMTPTMHRKSRTGRTKESGVVVRHVVVRPRQAGVPAGCAFSSAQQGPRCRASR